MPKRSPKKALTDAPRWGSPYARVRMHGSSLPDSASHTSASRGPTPTAVHEPGVPQRGFTLIACPTWPDRSDRWCEGLSLDPCGRGWPSARPGGLETAVHPSGGLARQSATRCSSWPRFQYSVCHRARHGEGPGKYAAAGRHRLDPCGTDAVVTCISRQPRRGPSGAAPLPPIWEPWALLSTWLPTLSIYCTNRPRPVITRSGTRTNNPPMPPRVRCAIATR